MRAELAELEGRWPVADHSLEELDWLAGFQRRLQFAGRTERGAAALRGS